MSHVPPHRWADALAGRLEDADVRAIERHAASCAPCKRARDRVQRASDSFPIIKSSAPPELPWDSVRARIHWSVSTERHERIKAEDLARRRRWVAPAAFGLAAAAALAYAAVTPPAPVAPPAVAITPARPAPVPAAIPVAPRALAGLVNRATGDVMVDGIRAADVFARRLVAGNRITTADGRVDVQFGDASAFALGPRSTLELVRFDAEAIELRVEGTIDIEVAHRAPNQTFVVRAGERLVEVRGTQFRVQHDKLTTTVACRHGLVAVRDAAGQVEVGPERRVVLAPEQHVTREHPAQLSAAELAALAEATPLSLPLFETLAQGSAPLEIATVGRRDVRIDGIELGLAPMRVRVLPGRHTVETADPAGRFRRAGWVDVSLTAAAPARLEVPADPPPTRNINARRRQLQTRMDTARIASCTRGIAKSGLRTGTYVQIEIKIDAQGAINFLNVIDTDLPTATASCVREVIADIKFGAGDAATLRERIDL